MYQKQCPLFVNLDDIPYYNEDNTVIDYTCMRVTMVSRDCACDSVHDAHMRAHVHVAGMVRCAFYAC